jgi:MFS family permease
LRERQTTLIKDRNLHIIFAITLIAIMGVSSITPAFPKIQKFFDISPQKVGWLITAFTLPGVILTPVLGILADRFGRKKILVPSLFLFAIAGAACFFTESYINLVIFRLLQGIGGASIGALNLTLIGDIFSGNNRTTAMGYNASVLSVGTGSYPIIGGALATLGWNIPFLLPLLALPVGLAVIFSLKNPEPEQYQKLKDYLKSTWDNVKNVQILGLFIISIITFIILYGSYLTYFPFLIDNRFHGDSFIIGMIMSAMSFTTAITSSQLGRLTKYSSQKKLIILAFVLYTISLTLIPFVKNIFILLIPTIIFGIAQGINIPNIQSLLASLAPMKQRAAIMSINGMLLRLGQTLGPIIIGSIYAAFGLNGAFWAGTLFSLVMVVIIIFMIKEN